MINVQLMIMLMIQNVANAFNGLFYWDAVNNDDNNNVPICDLSSGRQCLFCFC